MLNIKELRKQSRKASLTLSKYGYANKVLLIDDGRKLLAENVLNDIIHNAEGEIILNNFADEHHFIIDVLEIKINGIEAKYIIPSIDENSLVILKTPTFLSDDTIEQIQLKFLCDFGCEVIVLDERYDLVGIAQKSSGMAESK